MNRGTLVVVGGFALLFVGLVGGAGMLAAATPRLEPLPTVTPIVPVDPDGSNPSATAPATMPPVDIPGQRWGDVLRPDDVLVTREQLGEYARANEWRIGPNDEEWVAHSSLVIECMAEAGFWFDPRVFGGANGENLPDGFALALGGDTGAGDAYRWEDAGCWGYATHVLGITS